MISLPGLSGPSFANLTHTAEKSNERCQLLIHPLTRVSANGKPTRKIRCGAVRASSHCGIHWRAARPSIAHATAQCSGLQRCACSKLPGRSGVGRAALPAPAILRRRRLTPAAALPVDLADAVHAAHSHVPHFPAILADAVSALRPGQGGSSPVAAAVAAAQKLMGLADGARDQATLPTGAAVSFAEDPVETFRLVVDSEQKTLWSGSFVPALEWDKVVEAMDIDASVFLLAVVLIVPAFRALKLSPVLGFILAGLCLNQAGLFADNLEVDQVCELGIQFLLFEMGLELSVSRLKSLAKYAFGLGFLQIALVNAIFAFALLPAGDALGTRVLHFIQPDLGQDLIQIRSTLEALVISYALSLSSSAFTLQLLADKNLLSSRFGTATLGVLLFQDLSVVPFIVLLPLMLQANAGGLSPSELDVPVLAAASATSFLDLGILAVGGRWLALKAFDFVTKDDYGSDVFVALSLLVVTMFSSTADSIGFSDSLGAFIAGIVLADSPYAHRIIKELQTFKSLFLSLFFVTVGTTIDIGLVQHLLPIALVMAGTLMFTKIGVVAASGGLVGLSWQEALLTGAFVSQGGEFAFVIFGQVAGGNGQLFPTDLDRLLVVVVVLSMALTPLVVDLCFKIAGPDVLVGPCDDEECDSAIEFSEKFLSEPPEVAKEKLERALVISDASSDIDELMGQDTEK